MADCVAPPAGITAWWPAEGDASDSVNLNAGTIGGGLSFTTGEAGQAFNFNGTNAFVDIPASDNLNVGLSSGMTMEAWINPSDVSQPHPLLQWSQPIAQLPPDFGVSFWISLPPTNGGTGSGCLLVDLKSFSFQHRFVSTAPGLITAGVWQHVAATYDKSSGTASLYLNGSLVLQTNIGALNPYTATDLFVGEETDLINGEKLRFNDGQCWFAGQIDEFALYNRALTGAEVASVFAAGNAGKCAVPPTAVVVQPAVQSVAEGETALFTLTANGSPPLSYQWAFNGTNIPGATHNSLTLTNVHLTDAGNYSVNLSNGSGSVLGSNVSLVVTPSYAPTWKLTTAPINLTWMSVAISADGQKIAAASYEGFIYTSDDSGATWNSNSVPELNWLSISSTPNGMNLAAVGAASLTNAAHYGDGGVYTSTNAGVSWQETSLGFVDFLIRSLDESVWLHPDGYNLCVSTNAGQTWTTNSTPELQFFRLACSSNGTVMVACDYVGNIFTSSDTGNTWNLTTAPNTNYWVSLAMSADGNRIYAAARSDDSATNSLIISSSDSGIHWSLTGAPRECWVSLGVSEDGSRLVAGTYPGYLYISTDSGTNWTTTRAPYANWSSVASSADGTTLAAVQEGGGIYTWKPTALTITMPGNFLLISWPTNVPGFILQEQTMVGSSNWSIVTNAPVITNDQYQVTLPVSGSGNELFRLEYP